MQDNFNEFNQQLEFTNKLVKSIPSVVYEQEQNIDRNEALNYSTRFDCCLVLQFNLTVDKLRKSMYIANEIDALADAYLKLNTAKFKKETTNYVSKVTLASVKAFEEVLLKEGLMTVANVELYTYKLAKLMRSLDFTETDDVYLDNNTLEGWHTAAKHNIAGFENEVRALQMSDELARSEGTDADVRENKILDVSNSLKTLARIIRLSAVMMKDFQDAWHLFIKEAKSSTMIYSITVISLMPYLLGRVSVAGDYDIRKDSQCLTSKEAINRFNNRD